MSTRRDFLKQSGFLGAAAILSQSFAASGSLSARENVKQGFTVSMSKEIKTPIPNRVITIPDVGEFKVLKGDFHIHTIFSDGTVWPESRVSEAVANGLDVIAITDHIEYRPHIGGNGVKLRDLNDEYNIAYNRAKPVADRQKLLLIRGTEITKFKMPPGHFNALFVEDVNPIAAVVDDIWKMFEETKKQGGFLLWNHPGWQAPKSGGIEPGAPILFTEMHEEFYKKGFLDGVETFNGSEFYPNVPDWCEEKDLAIFANSDIHGSEFDTYGVRNRKRPITLVLAKERSLESIKEAFFAKRTIAWFNDMIAGQSKILADLFKACVEIKKEGNQLVFTNKSDIPVKVEADGKSVTVQPMSKATLDTAANTVSIANWLIGMEKAMEVTV